MDFIAIDFETSACETNSACALGMAFVDGLKIVETKYYLIHPPTLLFSKKNIEINGIFPEQVKDKPKFPIIWDDIKEHFDGACPIFAHNARFDMSVLMECLNYYRIELPSFPYYCSIPFSTKVCGGEVPKSLEARAEYFGIDIANHHNAECDAATCAQIIMETIKRTRYKSFNSFCKMRYVDFRDFQSLHPQKAIGKALFEQIDYSNAIVENDIPNSILKNKTVVITGEFSAFSRKELAQELLNLGAIVKNSVTKQTDYLLVGTQDLALVGEDGLSGKQEKAYALIEKGVQITILNEPEINEIISQTKKRPIAV